MKIMISRREVLDDIADAAFVSADVASASVDAHTLHQTLDLCEGNNLLRVNRLLDIAFGEAAAILRPVLDPTLSPEAGPDILTLHLAPQRGVHCGRCRSPQTLAALLREYLTAAVVSQWLELTLPGAAGAWRQQMERRALALIPAHHLTRPIHPF